MNRLFHAGAGKHYFGFLIAGFLTVFLATLLTAGSFGNFSTKEFFF
jgi:hypothetical protein